MKFDNLYLRKRPNFDEMINNLVLDNPKISYPDRFATIFRNSPYGSQFDGDNNSYIKLEEQQNKISKQRILEETLRQTASNEGVTRSLLEARSDKASSGYATPAFLFFGSEIGYDDYIDDIEEQQRIMQLEQAAKKHAVNMKIAEELLGISQGLTSDYMPVDIQEEYPLPTIRMDTPPPEEQASSSNDLPVYPTGLNPVQIPKAKAKARGRSTTRAGTKRETDEPEGIPRRVRPKSTPPIFSTMQETTKPTPKKQGRPPGSKNKPKV